MYQLKNGIFSIASVSVFTLFLTMSLISLPTLAQEVKIVEEEDHYALIVDFVVSRDPVLAVQRTVMDAARAMDTVRLEDSGSVPSYAQASLLKIKYEAVTSIKEAQQTYTTLERALVSELFSKLTEVLTLRNLIDNNKNLLDLLQQRLEPTERQVQAGIVPDSVLWNLSEQIIKVQITIADGQSNLVALERATAFNYGGEDWAELLELIRSLSKASK